MEMIISCFVFLCLCYRLFFMHLPIHFFSESKTILWLLTRNSWRVITVRRITIIFPAAIRLFWWWTSSVKLSNQEQVTMASLSHHLGYPMRPPYIMWNVFYLVLFMHVLCQKWRNKNCDIYKIIRRSLLWINSFIHKHYILVDIMCMHFFLSTLILFCIFTC